MRHLTLTTIVLATTALLAAPPAREVLVDRADDPAAWHANLGAEFPGAAATVLSVLAADGKPCVLVHYDFRNGGNYVAAERRLAVTRASAITFMVRQSGANSGLVRLRDATDQEHLASFGTTGDGWQKVTIPLDRQHFKGFWHGAADGEFHFPLSGVLIGVHRGRSAQGQLEFRDLSVVSDDPDLFCAVRFRSAVPGNVAFVGARQSGLTVVVENRVAEPARFVLRLGLHDWYRPEHYLPDRTVELGPHAVHVLPVAVPTNQPDYFQVSATLVRDGHPVHVGVGALAVVPRPRNFGVDDPQSYFAIQATSNGARTERLGVKWVRTYQDWTWSEQGEGHVTVPDLAAIRSHHQLIMHNLTATKPPGWLAKELGDKPLWEARGTQAWASFVEAVAGKLAPFVDTFEIQNEPDLTCQWHEGLAFEPGVQRYLTILRAAAPAVRKGAPNARLAGCDVSGGDYDRGLPYSQAVMTAAGKLLDVYSGHPYAGVRYFGDGQEPMWPVRNEERRKCLDTLAMIKRHGGSQRFWVGEKGWGLDVKADPLSSTSRDFAACLVQSMVIAKSVPGVEKYFWFIEEGCNEHGYEYGLFRQGQPLPAAVAYAAMAHTLHHAQPFASPELGLVQAHCFVAGGDGTLVLWSEGEKARLTIAAMPSSWQLLDLLGRKLATGKAGRPCRIDLDRAPVYLRFAAASAAAVCDALPKAKVDVREPLKLEAAYLPDLTHVAVRVRNVSPQAVRGAVQVDGAKRDVTVPGGQPQVVVFTTPSHLDRPAGSAIAVRLAAGELTQEATVPVALTACPAGAPKLDRAPDFVLDRREQVLPPDPGVGWTTPADLSVKAWIGWTAAGFHFTAEVHDPVQFAPSDEPGAFWRADSIQLGFDPHNAAPPANGYQPDDREFGLVLGPHGAKLVETVPQMRKLDLPVQASREGQTTRYEVTIPWKLLGVEPTAGQVMGFNFIANQDNGNGRAYWMGLTPGIGESKRPGVFRKVYLGRQS